jgi:hypothetical protein
MVYVNAHLEMQANITNIIDAKHAALCDLALEPHIHLIRASSAEIGGECGTNLMCVEGNIVDDLLLREININRQKEKRPRSNPSQPSV